MRKLFIITALVIGSIAIAQAATGEDKNKPTLLVGFYGGVNFTQPVILSSYSVNNSIGVAASTSEKAYNNLFSNVGNQFGFVMFYPAFGNFHIGLLPSYSSYKYGYQNEQTWAETDGSTLTAETHHTQKLRYFEMPLVLRYYIGTAKVKPFLEGILSYGLLHTADKMANSEFMQSNASATAPVQNTTLKSDYRDSYINSKFDAGLGAGVSYDFNQLILTLGASYNINLNNITNEKNRFSNELFVGSTYDVQDNLNLHALKVNLSVIFPISKITKKTSIECYYFKERKK